MLQHVAVSCNVTSLIFKLRLVVQQLVISDLTGIARIEGGSQEFAAPTAAQAQGGVVSSFVQAFGQAQDERGTCSLVKQLSAMLVSQRVGGIVSHKNMIGCCRPEELQGVQTRCEEGSYAPYAWH